MICVFLTPLIFYTLPFSLRVDQTVVHLTTAEISYATVVWITWILLSGSIIVVGQKFSKQQTLWHINRQGVWWCFVGFATLGSIISALHQTMQFPSIFENLTHILSLAPTLAIILGIYLLRLDALGRFKHFIIFLLLIPSGMVTFALPALLGYVNPIAISALGVLYALGVMRTPLRIQVGLLVLFVIGIGLALAFKSEIRTARYGGAFERDTTLVALHQKIMNESQNDDLAPHLCIKPLGEDSDEHAIETAKHAISNLIAYDSMSALTHLKHKLEPEEIQFQALNGNDLAMLSLGVTAEENAEDKQAITMAQSWYHRAIKQDNSNAMLRLGYLYERALIQPNGIEHAIAWYRRAAEKHNSNAMKVLSTMYEYGHGLPKNYFKAIVHDLQSMDLSLTEVGITTKPQNDPETLKLAMRKLGLLYENGIVVGKDLSKAGRWYQRAAILGDGVAMRHLASMYESGNGLAYNHRRALACYHDAAQKGDGPAMRIIGRMYELGDEIPRDYALAHKWYSKAATLEDASAIRYLANLYENGLGIPKDLLRAKTLYKQAQTLDPRDQHGSEVINKKDDLKEYDPNYHKLRWPLSQNTNPNLYHIIARIAHRLNSLGNFAYAIRMTPSQVPYSYWETYEPLFYKLIPRILWNDKPVEKTGLLIGLKYGYSKPTDKPFVWSMPTIFESWMAYGWGGIVLSAIALGTALHLGWHFFVGTSTAVGNMIFGTLIIMSTAHLSMSSLNLVIGGMIHTLLVFGVLIFAVIRICRLKT